MIGWWLNAVRQRECRAELAHEFDLQERMQFHAVFRNANLLVKDVKKSYAFHAYHPRLRQAAEMRFRLGELSGENLPHFRKVLRLRRTACALAFGRRRLGDHRAADVIGISQNQMKVAVAMLGGLLFPSQQHRLNGIDLLLGVGAFVAQDPGGPQRDQLRNAHMPRLEVDAFGIIIKDGLDTPAFSSAANAAGIWWRRWMTPVLYEQQEQEQHPK